MQFEQGHIYHIYNQGNNRQRIFFDRENYLFFLKKIKEHVLPHGDVLAWCLMPNHFHLMVEVREVAITPNAIHGVASSHVSTHPMTSSHDSISGGATSSRTPTTASDSFNKSEILTSNTPNATATHGVTQSHVSTHPMTSSHRMSERSLNQSIAIMLRSYTRAINKERGFTGSLFRPKTKAECITKPQGITPSFYHSEFGTIINTHNPEMDYPQVCFDYIHQNPVRANLVKLVEEWEFSSFRDYCGLRNGNLINRECGIKYAINMEAWR